MANCEEQQDSKLSTDFTSGFIVLIGRPSAGKSTLLNGLCGQKIAITSPKPQTTRNVIRGILNRSHTQLVFLDTPGFTKTETSFAKQLREELHSALRVAEGILYLVDLSRSPHKIDKDFASNELMQSFYSEERSLLKLLHHLMREFNKPLWFALNKSDLLLDESIKKERIASYCYFIREFFPQLDASQLFEISAKKKMGLESLITVMSRAMPEGPALYGDDIYTDQNPKFRIEELIREQALSFAGQELPYEMYVSVSDLEFVDKDSPLLSDHLQKAASEQKQVLWVRAFLQVARESQKGILVGKEGRRIRQIRQLSTKSIRKEFDCLVHLDLQVKTDYKWSRNYGLKKGKGFRGHLK